MVTEEHFLVMADKEVLLIYHTMDEADAAVKKLNDMKDNVFYHVLVLTNPKRN